MRRKPDLAIRSDKAVNFNEQVTLYGRADVQFRPIEHEDGITVIIPAEVKVEQKVNDFLLPGRQDVELEWLRMVRLSELKGALVAFHIAQAENLKVQAIPD